MSPTKEQILELAKEHGAKVVYEGAQTSVLFESHLDFIAYTSAIEEKHQAENAQLKKERDDWRERWGNENGEFADYVAQTKHIEEKYLAQIAMLRKELLRFKANFRRSDFNPNLFAMKCDDAISTTQASSAAFIAEVEARAESDGVKKAMELLLKHGEDHDWRIMAKNMGNGWVELRNQDKQPCTCDGRCDGFCLMKEGGK